MKIIHQTYISAFLFYLAIRFKFKYTFDFAFFLRIYLCQSTRDFFGKGFKGRGQ